METFDAIRTVLATRQFTSTPIPDEIVHKIVESAHLTGSSINLQPWHFVIIQNPDMLQKIGSMARSGPYIAQAPLAIVVGMEDSVYNVSDASRAIQSMILTAWSEGISSNWVGFNNMGDINPVLGIPASIKILAILPFGYAVEAKGKGIKKRKPLSEIAHKEHWDQPYE